MAVSVLHQFFDINTLLTLSMEPDGDAITGNYHRMVGLALKDPEGCVRSMPASDMDADKFSEYFHCSSSIVARTIETLQKFGLITIEDGKIFITLLRKDKMKKAAAQQKAEKRRSSGPKARPGRLPGVPEKQRLTAAHRHQTLPNRWQKTGTSLRQIAVPNQRRKNAARGRQINATKR